MVFPSTCQIPADVVYKSECFFMCNVTVGYQLVGASKVSCLESGSWSDDTKKTICRGNIHWVPKTVKTLYVKERDGGDILVISR